MAEETELERFMRFATAIAHNIPTDDGEELGDLIAEKSELPEEVLVHLAEWLLNLDFTNNEAIAILRLSRMIILQQVFQTKKTEEEIRA